MLERCGTAPAKYGDFVPSVNELAREAKACTRWNQLHPTKKARQGYLETQLRGRKGPVIISTDYIRAYSEQIREYVPSRFVSLGTDGFGRSDTRANLRNYFEVDARFITLGALHGLALEGQIDKSILTGAIEKMNIDPFQ